MTVPKEIKDFVEHNIEMMIAQTKTLRPFIDVAFPDVKNLVDGCYNLIAWHALSIFMNQYAMRLQSPTKKDFEEFGKMTSKYRDRIEKIF